MMVGPRKDTIKFFVEGKVHLVQETDGVRILGNAKQEFLHKIPNEVEDVFKIGEWRRLILVHAFSFISNTYISKTRLRLAYFETRKSENNEIWTMRQFQNDSTRSK